MLESIGDNPLSPKYMDTFANNPRTASNVCKAYYKGLRHDKGEKLKWVEYFLSLENKWRGWRSSNNILNRMKKQGIGL